MFSMLLFLLFMVITILLHLLMMLLGELGCIFWNHKMMFWMCLRHSIKWWRSSLIRSNQLKEEIYFDKRSSSDCFWGQTKPNIVAAAKLLHIANVSLFVPSTRACNRYSQPYQYTICWSLYWWKCQLSYRRHHFLNLVVNPWIISHVYRSIAGFDFLLPVLVCQPTISNQVRSSLTSIGL